MSQTVSNPKAEEPCTDVEPFLAELTGLSRKHRIGIAGDPVLFCLEDEDLDRTYSSDADSALVY